METQDSDQIARLRAEHAKAVAELGDMLVKRMILDEAIVEKRRVIEAIDRAAFVLMRK